MRDLTTAELRLVKKAVRDAYEKGRAAERREFDAFLARMRALKELNGSADAFLKAYSPGEKAKGRAVEMEHTDDPAEADRIAADHLAEDPAYYSKLDAAGLADGKGSSGDNPHDLVAAAMLAHAEESLSTGADPLPGLDRLRDLLDDPAALAELLGQGGADDATVGKCFRVLKAFTEADHPRGKSGQFIAKDRIEAAKTDPEVAKQLRAEVAPEDAGKLDAALGGKAGGRPAGDPGRAAAKASNSAHQVSDTLAEFAKYDGSGQTFEEYATPARDARKNALAATAATRAGDTALAAEYHRDAALAHEDAAEGHDGWSGRDVRHAEAARLHRAAAARHRAAAGIVQKAWNEADHPRGKGGHFISKDRIEAAKTDPKLAKELRAEVKPEDAGKLDAALEGKTDLGRTKRGQARHEAAGRRATRDEANAKTQEFLTHFRKVGDLKADLTADHLYDLAEHIKSEHVTIDDVRQLRTALHGAGGGKASFGGQRKRQALVDALRDHARGRGLKERAKELGLDGGELSGAVGTRDAGEPVAPPAGGRTPPATTGQYGAWGRAAAGEPAPAPPPAQEGGHHVVAYQQAKDLIGQPGRMVGGIRMKQDVIRAAAKQWGVDEIEAEARLENGGRAIEPDAVTQSPPPVSQPEQSVKPTGKPGPHQMNKSDYVNREVDKAGKKGGSWMQVRDRKEAARVRAEKEWEAATEQAYIAGEKVAEKPGWAKTGVEWANHPAGPGPATPIHRKEVADALAAGKPVPAEVLADYPDLAPAEVLADYPDLAAAAAPAATPPAPASGVAADEAELATLNRTPAKKLTPDQKKRKDQLSREFTARKFPGATPVMAGGGKGPGVSDAENEATAAPTIPATTVDTPPGANYSSGTPAPGTGGTPGGGKMETTTTKPAAGVGTLDLFDTAGIGRVAREVAAGLPGWNQAARQPDSPVPHKVTILDAYEALKPRLGGASLDDFKAAVVAAQNAGHLTLEPVDMRTDSAAQNRRIAQSEVLGGAFHAISVPPGGTPTPAPAAGGTPGGGKVETTAAVKTARAKFDAASRALAPLAARLNAAAPGTPGYKRLEKQYDAADAEVQAARAEKEAAEATHAAARGKRYAVYHDPGTGTPELLSHHDTLAGAAAAANGEAPRLLRDVPYSSRSTPAADEVGTPAALPTHEGRGRKVYVAEVPHTQGGTA